MSNPDKNWLHIEILWCVVLILALFVAHLIAQQNEWYTLIDSDIMSQDNTTLLCVEPSTKEFITIGTRTDLPVKM